MKFVGLQSKLFDQPDLTVICDFALCPEIIRRQFLHENNSMNLFAANFTAAQSWIRNAHHSLSMITLFRPNVCKRCGYVHFNMLLKKLQVLLDAAVAHSNVTSLNMHFFDEITAKLIGLSLHLNCGSMSYCSHRASSIINLVIKCSRWPNKTFVFRSIELNILLDFVIWGAAWLVKMSLGIIGSWHEKCWNFLWWFSAKVMRNSMINRLVENYERQVEFPN